MKADGGAAFPVLRTGPKYTERGTPYGEQIYSVGGMSLRDYYVGQVMPALIIAFGHDAGYDREGAVAEASKLVDAMLAERERTEE